MKILFIGARLFDEVAFYAHEKGIETILSESSPDSPNLNLADKYFLVPRGMDYPLEIAIKEDVDAVVPLIGIDTPLLEVAQLKDKLEKEYNLPVIASGLSATEIAINKLKTKKFLAEHNIKTPEYREISQKQYYQNNNVQTGISSKLEYPAVLKQATGQGGLGIKIALSQKDVDNYFKEYQSAMVERFIKGTEISIEVLSWNGKYIALTPVDKGETTMEGKHPLTKMRRAPAQLENQDNEQVRMLAQDIVHKLGASGTIDVDFIFDPLKGELNALEVNTRPSGTRYLTLTATSINPLHQLVNMALGEWSVKNVEADMESNAALEMIIPPHRKVELNEIFKKDQKNHPVIDLFSKERPWVVHGHEKAQRITIKAKNNNEAIKIAKKLKIME
ncbi:ATP-grasp domain-containing protein [Methanobacterium alkalithermotolerans]|uniref:Carbamoyl-phosphate synthase n=1 Tax=Methanobacterium alkalithermotolerans TaxID=2731220 RepID=A0A8T8K729_9EURY|nr:ATP-grasp domain-containing protein [Methanobacterium alkalithermotolerans]QUH22810.1 ATP-grasp domain-containing protein [Methanobacterium alkalithermotolerans]